MFFLSALPVRLSLLAAADALCAMRSAFFGSPKKKSHVPILDYLLFTDVLKLCLINLIATKNLKENAKNNLN